MRVVEELGLRPHPEGGYYRETYRAPFEVAGSAGARRAASTAIYYLLPAGEFSAWHRVQSDEVWHFYGGDPLDLHLIHPDGVKETVRLDGHHPQAVVAAGVWQAAVTAGDRYALCGCTVAPGFDFADFELGAKARLLALFPQHEELIVRLVRH